MASGVGIMGAIREPYVEDVGPWRSGRYRMMETPERYKFPRMSHLPRSIYVGADDKRVSDISHLHNREIVITEKIDGENTAFYPDYIHARSITGNYHPSQSWVRGYHASIKHLIPHGYRIYGENVYACHSIKYNKLSTYFYVILVVNNDMILSWKDTKEFCQGVGMETVPEYYCGIFDEDVLIEYENCFSHYGDRAEGYVIRSSDSIEYDNFSYNFYKFVKSPILSQEHWKSKKVIPNIINK